MKNVNVFSKQVHGFGQFTIQAMRIPDDIPLVQSWVSQAYARYWGMAGFSIEQVEQGYRAITQNADAFIGCLNNKPVFLLERYHPSNDPVGEYYDVQSGDMGMHILVSPADKPIANFTWTIFHTVMDFVFSDPLVSRVVVEPDVRNEKIHALNKRAGFVYDRVIDLNGKKAHLAFCTRQQFNTAINREINAMKTQIASSPESAVQFLSPEVWGLVNRLHIRKAIAEFSHELLFQPEVIEQQGAWTTYRLSPEQNDNNVEYVFRAQLLSLEHWQIDTDSITRTINGDPAELDSMSFIIEFSTQLGISDEILPTYLEEITSTLYGSAYKHTVDSLSAEQLTKADFQQVETAMMEGHPVFVANNGRIGFDAIDYQSYAPEAGSPLQLLWIAVAKERTVFACSEDLSYQELLEQELPEHTLTQFSEILTGQNLNPDDYLNMPVHPWQWFNKLAAVFSPEIAARRIVCLGYGEDAYLAQQSIRTFFNTSQPNKRYVKTALSILNMGFMRGLSPYYMSHTPAINDWINRLIEHDPYLASKGFSILREVAAIGYRNTYFEDAIKQDTPYKKMLSALWRESPMPQLKKDQRLMTMASLLHIDAKGDALLPAMVRSSGLDTADWIKRYLDCYMSPLLHCFYAHDLVFMPHGENLIMVFEKNAPVRAIMKDIAEECAIMNTDVVLSENVRRLSVHVPDELKVLSIFTDLFDCIFRFIAAILEEQGGFPEQRFWPLVAECVIDYQQAHPEMADKFAKYDLFTPEFTRSCLNRLQLNNNQQMIDLQDPAKNLQFIGTLKNPIAEYKSQAVGCTEAIGA